MNNHEWSNYASDPHWSYEEFWPTWAGVKADDIQYCASFVVRGVKQPTNQYIAPDLTVEFIDALIGFIRDYSRPDSLVPPRVLDHLLNTRGLNVTSAISALRTMRSGLVASA
jgi:hypothetical protein